MPIKNFTQPNRLPTNNRVIDKAQHALNLLAPYQQRKYEAAFFVNPIEILLYNKLNGGIECACTFGDHEAPVAPILGEDGKASPATLQTLLTGKRFGITDYGINGTDANNRINPILPVEDVRGNSISSLTYVANSTLDPHATTNNDFGAVGSNTVVEGLEDDSPPDLQNPDHLESEQLNRSIRSTDNRSCPICFGSGYVGGYAIHGGWRKVLDCRSTDLTVFKGEIDSIATPNQATVMGDGYAEYAVKFPAHIVTVDTFRVMNGKYLAKNVSVSVRDVGGSTFTPVDSIPTIKSFCDGKVRLVRISSSDSVNLFKFTHLEIQFNLSTDPLLAEYPRFGENSDLNLLEKLQDVQINLTNKVISLHSEDVIFDSSVAKLWKVSAAQFYRDHSQNVIGWDCNAAVVQPYETQMILPARYSQKSKHQRSTTPIRQTRVR